eukprot:CAMPEP_0194769938 /NCGR_PEP_ID=MMETSP0323_2-20130528/44711_1 /TAXON_ID=2866 ORGANISM="Crypthecodinium cohnii, Strain Seligo" /NCGR_SAMPLE_ID=MMETSP0323_2 /ASSEMBLY_ACC=CAM_ASM_000346 /LENGTH=98 /DNA_ID=CAMNT_0039703211 /DNA_START=501 /DNA_END=798 /DNA_ORIENTATION=-
MGQAEVLQVTELAQNIHKAGVLWGGGDSAKHLRGVRAAGQAEEVEEVAVPSPVCSAIRIEQPELAPACEASCSEQVVTASSCPSKFTSLMTCECLMGT